ncbi:MAG: PhzF family phenazine biosynthesis protein [Filifactor alocis]|nr:PhzF family phenazine biosynthesis protein [Filifactor alocis]
MRVFVADAFTSEKFSGNQAGIVLLEKGEDYPGEEFMKKLAAELKHSETVFVKQEGEGVFRLRYFTPTEEVDLCGHATIATFSTLREEGWIQEGMYKALTLAGELEIAVEDRGVWMDMAVPCLFREFSREESRELYEAFGLGEGDRPELLPKIISTGLPDIMVPVASKKALDGFVMDRERVVALSEKYEVIGMHLFALDLEGKVTAYCRNVAPLVGIDEECATGTSNGALTHYLDLEGLIDRAGENTFVQGESMGRASVIKSRYRGSTIVIGGDAVITMECFLW